MNAMKTTTKTAAPKIETVIESRYKITSEQADATVVEWAACHLAETHGIEHAAKEWKRINAKRHKLGRYTNIPQWGTPMFEAYFAKKAG